MEKSISEFLKSFNKKDIYPFHMPGHKRNRSFLQENDFLSMDITEIEGADNLKNPKGIIKQAEEKIANAYGARKSYMLVNGSSSGILAAIMYCVKDGDEILIGRNSHESAYNGLILSGAYPRYIYPEITTYGIAGGISAESVKKKLEEYVNIKAVFITSPTYEGFCSDIEGISQVTKSFGKILIVDEAHGAHFGFHNGFPKSSIEMGADIVIQSFHKTLPALNQSAVMHIGKNSIDIELMKDFINMVQTTSPSYIMMALMERSIDLITENKDIFENYYEMILDFRKSLEECNFIKLIDKKIVGKHGIHDIDTGKCVFISDANILDAPLIYNKILVDYKIQLEMCGLNHFLAMTSICDTKEGFFRLKTAIYDLNNEKYLKRKYKFEWKNFQTNNAILSILPKKAICMTKNIVSLQDAKDKISAGFITPYPPGIPLVAPGEIITEEILKVINEYIKENINIIGIENNKCKILK